VDPIVYERFDRVYRTGESISGREFSIMLDWDRTGTLATRYLRGVQRSPGQKSGSRWHLG
jgi:hypothetical protein